MATCSIHEKAVTYKGKMQGLIDGHAYTILKFYEVYDEEKKKISYFN